MDVRSIGSDGFMLALDLRNIYGALVWFMNIAGPFDKNHNLLFLLILLAVLGCRGPLLPNASILLDTIFDESREYYRHFASPSKPSSPATYERSAKVNLADQKLTAIYL